MPGGGPVRNPGPAGGRVGSGGAGRGAAHGAVRCAARPPPAGLPRGCVCRVREVSAAAGPGRTVPSPSPAPLGCAAFSPVSAGPGSPISPLFIPVHPVTYLDAPLQPYCHLVRGQTLTSRRVLATTAGLFCPLKYALVRRARQRADLPSPAQPSPRWPSTLPLQVPLTSSSAWPLPLPPLPSPLPLPPPMRNGGARGRTPGSRGAGVQCAPGGAGARRAARGRPDGGGGAGERPGAAAASLGDWREEEAHGARGQRNGLSPTRLK